MKEIAVTLSVCACIALSAFFSCGDEEDAVADGGGVTAAQTEAYFGLAGTKTYEGTQELESGPSPITYEVAYAVDTKAFTNKSAIARTWTTGGFAILTEWFEVKGAELYFLRYKYMDDAGQEQDVSFATPVLYGKNPWTDADAALSTTVGSDTYEYSIVKESVTVPAGTYADALKVYAKEGSRSGAYYFVPDTGVVKYQITGHPALKTIAIGLK